MQLLTNRLGLPDAIVRAVQNDPYDAGECDISVTRLIQPPQIHSLFVKHKDEIVEDAADRIFSLLGQTVHGILERAGGTAERESRLYTTCQNWVVSGAFDRYENGLLEDYKITSVYSVMGDEKREWTEQLNLLAELCWRNQRPVDRVRIVAILRDWRRADSKKRSDYPQQMIQVVDVPLWTRERASAFLEERVQLHQAAQAGDVQPCSNEDRWFSGEFHAVMKKGGKRAVKLHDKRADAERHVADLGKDHFVEFRPGEYRRCAHYCPVAEFCPQVKASQPLF